MKNKNIVRLIVLFLGLTFTSVSLAKSPVFKVSKGLSHVYIGGTLHLLSKNDYPLPDAFYQAFDAADHVFFETDTTQISSPEVQAQLSKVMVLHKGESLQEVLNKETYTRLEAYLKERDLESLLSQNLTPSAISINLTILELNRLKLGDPANGVDHFFSSKTKESGKKIFYLETIEQQIGFLSKFNDADPNVMLNANLDDLAKLRENWKEALGAWRDGDIETLVEHLGGDKLKSDFPEMYKVLLIDRNNHWLTKIKEMFASQEVELVLVGAAHLAYDEGLIELLRKDGYKVEQLD